MLKTSILQNEYYNIVERNCNEPKVNNNEPPIKPPPKASYGSYCFRAYTTMTENDDILSEYTGYDDKMDIVDRVDRYCELNRTNKNAICNPSKLSFIGGNEKCDGRILMYDTKHNFTRTFYD